MLVEGIAERLLFPKFFSMLYMKNTEEDTEMQKKKTIEGEGISIISVDGVAFRPFLQLFGSTGLGIKCAAITDSDPESVPLENEDGTPVLGRDNKVVREEVYPTEIGEYENCPRTAKLINDFRSHQNIFISNNIKTFEYDLILNNNVSFFIELIQEYNLGTNEDRARIVSLSGQEFAKEAYKLISKEKGEFSQLILDKLNSGKTLHIPMYIEKAFEFLMSEEGDGRDE